MLLNPATKNITGKVGEYKVNIKLNPLILGNNHKLISNLIIVDENSKSHQIDHVVIRENGIFCIETKNYKGWIFGSEKQDKWTQCLYNKEKHQFVNPLKQNKSHIYHISKVLGNRYIINSVVVLVQNNADKIECENVINLKDLKSYLNNFDNGVKLSKEEIDSIYNKLMSSSTKMTNREHVKNIRQTQKEIEDGICPRCGGNLILKQGKYGNFKGCSNYPNCKFTMNIK